MALTLALLQSSSQGLIPLSCVRALEVLQPEAVLLCDHYFPEWGLWHSVRGPSEPSPSPAPVVGWPLPFTSNSLSAAGQLPGEPGQSQGAAPLAPTRNLSLLGFLACSACGNQEVRSFGNQFLVLCILAYLNCHLQTSMASLSLPHSVPLSFPVGSLSQFSLYPPAFILDHILFQV